MHLCNRLCVFFVLIELAMGCGQPSLDDAGQLHLAKTGSTRSTGATGATGATGSSGPGTVIADAAASAAMPVGIRDDDLGNIARC